MTTYKVLWENHTGGTKELATFATEQEAKNYINSLNTDKKRYSYIVHS